MEAGRCLNFGYFFLQGGVGGGSRLRAAPTSQLQSLPAFSHGLVAWVYFISELCL